MAATSSWRRRRRRLGGSLPRGFGLGKLFFLHFLLARFAILTGTHVGSLAGKELVLAINLGFTRQTSGSSITVPAGAAPL